MSIITLNNSDMMRSLLQIEQREPMARRHYRWLLKLKWWRRLG